MSVIIRPAPGVFQRKLPLVVVFGGYRRYEFDAPLRQNDLRTVTDVVGLARRARAPIAFAVPADEDGDIAPGVWLPGCRPRVTDRVYRSRGGSLFANPEFRGVYRGTRISQVVFTGPANDSRLQDTIQDPLAFGRRITVIASDRAMQNCSTPDLNRAAKLTASSARKVLSTITFDEWERNILPRD